MADSFSPQSEPLNAVTRGQSNVVLKVAQDPKNASSSKQLTSSKISNYDLVSQLQRTPTKISIFELLELSPLHKDILEKALHSASVPMDIDMEQFQAMVNLISSSHHLAFFEEDDRAPSHRHNLTLHIEVQIFHTHVRRVLIDNGARLNIISFHVIQQLGMSKFSIDPRHKITIKAYDKFERSSKGLIVLPIRVGPVEREVVFQVLDIPLAYNLLLG